MKGTRRFLLVGIALQLSTGCAGVQKGPPAFMDTASARCLKEGESCSTLNDDCCPGYRCPMGLEPRCVGNPVIITLPAPPVQ